MLGALGIAAFAVFEPKVRASPGTFLTFLLAVGALALLLFPVARLTRRMAFALQSMQAVVTEQELNLTTPTWGTWLGASPPIEEIRVGRHDIEAVEVARDPTGFGLARKAELVMNDGRRVQIWRCSEGMRKQWTWTPRGGWREQTAATYAMTTPTGVTWQFRLMGALSGFAQRLAVALDVPYRNRVAMP